jgi:hypothetical protein
MPRKCKHCTTQPSYGKIGGSRKDAEFCKEHCPDGYINVISKRCCHPNCTILPSYGKVGGSRKDAEFCKEHCPDGYVDVTHKRCRHPNCTTRPSYGKVCGSKKDAEFCKEHCPDGYVDVRSKRCRHPNCTTQPSYGKIGGSRKDAEFCKQHCLDGYVNVISKRCCHPNCTTLPSYGKVGGSQKDAEFCKEHCPDGYVDVISKRCRHPNCTTRPSYGKIGSSKKDAEFCKEHCPDGYVDVRSKRCRHPNCTTGPSYGKIGSSQKDAEFCKEHCPDGYVDVTHKRCSHPNCATRPSYNFLGFNPEYCSKHIKKGMVVNPLKKCCECGKKASYWDKDGFYCDTHETKMSINLENLCYICNQVFVSKQGDECVGCQEYNKHNKTSKRKEKEGKIYKIIDEGGFSVESYDRQVKGGCSLLRPDFIITTKWGVIVLEVDEFQHNRKTYNCECEITRMKKIYFDIGVENLLYIRYNPDDYRPSYGKVFTESKRQEYVIRKLKKYIEEKPKYCCTVMYIFYDGFTEMDNEEEILDPYADDNYYFRCEKCLKMVPLVYVNDEMVCRDC